MENPENNLYQIWNTEGEPNVEALAILHEFHTLLKDEKRFVGIVPFGSNFKGKETAYNEETSDVDLVILFTSDQKFDHPVDAPGSVLKEIRVGSFDFLEKVTNAQDALQTKYGRTVNILTQIVEPFTYTNEDDKEKINYFAVARIAQLTTGENSSPLRQKVRDFFQKQTEEVREVMLDQVLSVLIDEDRKSTPKMLERNIFANETEREEWIRERKELWKKRLQELFI